MRLRRALAVLLEELVEPLDGLDESGLLGELDFGLVEVAADGETVLDAGVQNHLVRDGAHVFEDSLGLVTLVFGEDRVGLCDVVSDGIIPSLIGFSQLTSGSNRKRTSHASELGLVDKRRVSGETDIDALALGQETRNVLATKAVADSTNLLRTLLLHVCQSLLDNRVDGVRQVALALRAALGQPSHDVEVACSELVELNGVALEEIGHDDPVAVGGELVGDQLRVDKGVAHDIGKDDDGVGGVLVLGVADVGGD